LFNKKNISLFFLVIANLILFFVVEFKIFSLVIMFELLTIIPIKQYFEKSQEEKKDQNNIVNESSIDKEVIESLFDQFSSSVFVLNKDFTIHNQNFKSKKIYNVNLNKDIASVIRDYDFISQFEKFKKNNDYNIFDWSKPLPDNQFFRAEIFTLSNFYIVNIIETTFEKNKQENFNDGLTSLTHELKTPLSVIIGYLETIDLENLSNQENQKYVNIINSKTFQMRDLIDQTLKLSEIESLSIQKVSNDLHSLLEKSLDNYSILFKKKGIDLDIDISASKDIFFDFTPNDFEVVFNNLLSNALKYTPPGKNVYISTTKTPDNKITIKIRDEGAGISQTDLDKVTTKFFRADQSRNSDTGGHGLGLAIVDKLLVKNGHKLIFSSILGEGSTFQINLSLS
jgi:two-component system phosphate regulon sensor histidine kinase PhoR